VVASGSVIVEDMTEHEHAAGHTDEDGILGRYQPQTRRRHQVLPGSFAQRADRLTRFIREAQAPDWSPVVVRVSKR
jgi:hypothetical protein